MHIARLSLLALLVVAAHGCSGKSDIQISGKVTKKGAPLELAPNIKLSIIFAPEATQKQGNEVVSATYPVGLNFETSEYSVELPPGKYKAKVVYFDNGAKGGPKMLPINPEFTKTVFDFTSSKSGVDLEIGP